MCADWTVKDYVRCWRIHLGPMYRPEDMYVGNYAGALDALNAGVTLVVDYCHNVVTRDHGREALRGLRDAGIRALFGLAYTPVLDHGFAAAPSFEVENPDLPDHASRVAFAKQLASEEFSSKDQLVSLAIVPQEIEIARSFDDVVTEFNSARDLDAQISLHANQSLTGHRWEDVRKLAPRRPARPRHPLRPLHVLGRGRAEDDRRRRAPRSRSRRRPRCRWGWASRSPAS